MEHMFKGRSLTFSFVALGDEWISLSLKMVLWTLVDVIFVNSTFIVMVQQTSTTTHVATMIA
jgi:hypothetical protein